MPCSADASSGSTWSCRDRLPQSREAPATVNATMPSFFVPVPVSTVNADFSPPPTPPPPITQNAHPFCYLACSLPPRIHLHVGHDRIHGIVTTDEHSAHHSAHSPPWMFLRRRCQTPARLTSNFLVMNLSQAPRRIFSNTSTESDGPSKKKLPSFPRPSASLLLVNKNDEVSESPSVGHFPKLLRWLYYGRLMTTLPVQVLMIQRTLSTRNFAGMHVSHWWCYPTPQWEE